MANASELLHFVKHDRQLQGAPHIMEAQDSLAEAVQLAFSHLVDCLQEELANAMPAFLEESLRDLDADDGTTLKSSFCLPRHKLLSFCKPIEMYRGSQLVTSGTHCLSVVYVP